MKTHTTPLPIRSIWIQGCNGKAQDKSIVFDCGTLTITVIPREREFQATFVCGPVRAVSCGRTLDESIVNARSAFFSVGHEYFGQCHAEWVKIAKYIGIGA
jgi:hypothetical protein